MVIGCSQPTRMAMSYNVVISWCLECHGGGGGVGGGGARAIRDGAVFDDIVGVLRKLCDL